MRADLRRSQWISEGLVNASFLIQENNGLEWLVSASLARFPWLVHGFSTRRGGVSKAPAAGLNLGTTHEASTRPVSKNRRMFLDALGAEKLCLASVHQIHSAEILQVTKVSDKELRYQPAACETREESGQAETCGDALVTAEAGVLLSVRTADCLPILVVDPESRVIAAVHAGWRGALRRIAEKTIGEMRRIFGSHPGRLHAALGPCIHACCYEVGEEVVDDFSGQFVNSEAFFVKATHAGAGKPSFAGMPFLSMTPPGHERPAGSGLCLDLPAVVRSQLKSAGVPASHIQTADFCTSCRTGLFFSYRKEGSATGRMMAVIGVQKEKRLYAAMG